ncbi:hypothetical protein BKA60DRAFT_686420 [Fusarium oxysporum]|nr:hypothetical protein BKA60DRAFT_686420 [Fusarium oxysporum]
MPTEEDLWDALSEGEQNPVQIETERNFRIHLRSKKEAENNKIEEDFLLSSNETRLKLNDIQGKYESSWRPTSRSMATMQYPPTGKQKKISPYKIQFFNQM